MWIGKVGAGAILPDDTEALRAVLCHHQREVVDPAADLLVIFRMALE